MDRSAKPAVQPGSCAGSPCLLALGAALGQLLLGERVPAPQLDRALLRAAAGLPLEDTPKAAGAQLDAELDVTQRPGALRVPLGRSGALY